MLMKTENTYNSPPACCTYGNEFNLCSSALSHKPGRRCQMQLKKPFSALNATYAWQKGNKSPYFYHSQMMRFAVCSRLLSSSHSLASSANVWIYNAVAVVSVLLNAQHSGSVQAITLRQWFNNLLSLFWLFFKLNSGGIWRWSRVGVGVGGGFELERIPLQRLSKHHFNSKHLLGVLNWHLLRCGMHKRSFSSPLALLPSSPFVTSLFTPIFSSPLLPAILLSPISLLPLPPSVWTGTTPPTLMNASASLFPCNYVRPT